MKPPAAGKPEVKRMDPVAIEAMLAACKGTRFADRRDKALVWVLFTSGLRANECVSLTLADVDVRARTITVRHGKGDKQRIVNLHPKAIPAVDAYLRARRHHPHAMRSQQFWLGEIQHPTFGTQGLRHALGRRAEAAGITGFHPHRLRHSFASWCKERGMSDDELMALAGWSDPSMARLYTADTAARRARETHGHMELPFR